LFTSLLKLTASHGGYSSAIEMAAVMSSWNFNFIFVCYLRGRKETLGGNVLPFILIGGCFFGVMPRFAQLFNVL